MPALLYGFFACYAVTGKCELRTDSQGRDLAVFTSLEDCQRFGSGPAQQRPNSEGKWLIGDGHYYQCLSMAPSSGPPAQTAPVAGTAPAGATAPAAATMPAAVAAVTAAAAAGSAAAVTAPGATAAKPPPTAAVTAAAAAPPSAPAPRTPATPPTSAVPIVAAVPAATAALPAAATVPAAAAAARPDTPRPVYRTTAEALQHDFEVNPDALNRKIGSALVQVSGTVANRTNLVDGALQLAGGTSDVTAWIEKDEIAFAQTLSKRAYVTLSCDRIGTLVAPSARRPGIVEVRDCRLLSPGG